jgi:ABC-type uncharacterized transport system substrate-binding protein
MSEDEEAHAVIHRSHPARKLISQYDLISQRRAGDLPFELPTIYRLIINLKTAKSLGLTVPDKLLVTAHQVIE